MYLQSNTFISIMFMYSFMVVSQPDCDNFTMITILDNNDVLTWDYKGNNKYQQCYNQ